MPNAQPYPLHGDYLGKSIEYTDELLRAYPDNDVEVGAGKGRGREKALGRSKVICL